MKIKENNSSASGEKIELEGNGRQPIQTIDGLL